MAIEKPTTLYRGVVVVLPSSSNTGTVAQVADGTCLRVTDQIAFAEEPNVEFDEGGETYRLVRDQDVLGWYYRAPDPEPIPPD